VILELISGELFDRTISLNRSRVAKRQDNGNFTRVLSDLKECCRAKAHKFSSRCARGSSDKIEAIFPDSGAKMLR
jgi:hypothetical protein